MYPYDTCVQIVFDSLEKDCICDGSMSIHTLHLAMRWRSAPSHAFVSQLPPLMNRNNFLTKGNVARKESDEEFMVLSNHKSRS